MNSYRIRFKFTDNIDNEFETIILNDNDYKIIQNKDENNTKKTFEIGHKNNMLNSKAVIKIKKTKTLGSKNINSYEPSTTKSVNEAIIDDENKIYLTGISVKFENNNDNLFKEVTKILKTIDAKFNETTIVTVIEIKNENSGTKFVVVKFVSKTIKDEIYKKRQNLVKISEYKDKVFVFNNLVSYKIFLFNNNPKPTKSGFKKVT